MDEMIEHCANKSFLSYKLNNIHYHNSLYLIKYESHQERL